MLNKWTTKEVVCLKETMAFKYRLFEPCDSLHFFTTCPNPESKCRKQRQNHRSLSLTIVLCLHPDGKNKNIRKPCHRYCLSVIWVSSLKKKVERTAVLGGYQHRTLAFHPNINTQEKTGAACDVVL
uniref:Uncharacterized protein n=1 Tax=Oreochromis niloticus TaxID=8128 RepID=A0A669CQG5_ORENI